MTQEEIDIEAEYAWIDAIPEDPYTPCPCGCGKKWRFVIKDMIEEEVAKHEKQFKVNFKKNLIAKMNIEELVDFAKSLRV